MNAVTLELSLSDQYFSVPLQIARRKLSGMRDSLVASSIWRSDFKKSLETFPEFEVHHLEYSEPGCDACHLGSRMSTRLGRLSGLPYDPTTFEVSIVSTRMVHASQLLLNQSFAERDSSDGDSDDDEDHAKHTKKEFNLGRFCAARTRVYHSFSHWEVHPASNLHVIHVAHLTAVGSLQGPFSGSGRIADGCRRTWLRASRIRSGRPTPG